MVNKINITNMFVLFSTITTYLTNNFMMKETAERGIWKIVP